MLSIAHKEYELSFSSLRISTMTTTAQTNTKINIPKLYELVQLLPYHQLQNGIIKIQTGNGSRGVSWQNIMKQEKKSKKGTTRKAFFNQATLVVRREVSHLYWKEINVKLFKNGGAQMTGVRSTEMAHDTLAWLLDHLTETCKDVFEETPRIDREAVHLINSGFSIGAPIRREILHTLLSHTYHLSCLYETTVYQGVKTKYFYNTHPVRAGEEGRCTCGTLCEGNGTGSGVNQCKKITISPFQTGEVIIQASGLPDGTLRHIHQAMKFIQSVFVKHAPEVIRKQYVLPGADVAPATVDVDSKDSWIPHPTPRSLVVLPRSSLVNTPV